MAARIYQEAKNPMQSGRGRAGRWVLEFDAADKQRHDPVTGWIGSADTQKQVRLTFPTLDAATAYAEREGITFEVRRVADRVLKLQAYADNFR
ncbi:ETC complex I subunit [Sphingoaurantiacus capsulatus]|uniref:ETC complex I subunit n=1 Tax=Sphingoaurantiacus capsulatus TaxID=1771310 RepID=A0ABV7XF99_9SPHN